jgi:hypothetical protein
VSRWHPACPLLVGLSSVETRSHLVHLWERPHNLRSWLSTVDHKELASATSVFIEVCGGMR